MEKYEISQVLVEKNSNFIGLVTERALLGLDTINLMEKKASDVMIESPPVVDLHAKLGIVVGLLKFYPLVLVKENVKIVGVVTKSDVIKSLK